MNGLVKVADFGHLVLWRIKAYWQRTLVDFERLNLGKYWTYRDNSRTKL